MDSSNNMAHAIRPLEKSKVRLCLLCGQWIELHNFKWENHRNLCEKIYIDARPWLKQALEDEEKDELLKKFKKNREN